MPVTFDRTDISPLTSLVIPHRMLYNLTVTGKRQARGGKTATRERRRCKSATGASGRNSQAKGPCSANTLESSARNTDGASLSYFVPVCSAVELLNKLANKDKQANLSGLITEGARLNSCVLFCVLIAKKPRQRARRQFFYGN